MPFLYLASGQPLPVHSVPLSVIVWRFYMQNRGSMQHKVQFRAIHNGVAMPFLYLHQA